MYATTIIRVPGCSSAWLERVVWDHEGAGSNPVTPIQQPPVSEQLTGGHPPVIRIRNRGTTLILHFWRRAMPRTRPTTNPLSYHRHTGQYYITRSGKRIYLGANLDEATERYHRLCLGLGAPERPTSAVGISAKELANRFIAAQQANWREPETTLRSYQNWLGRFLRDHPRLLAADLTVQAFAAWKLSLRQRGYSPKAINHDAELPDGPHRHQIARVCANGLRTRTTSHRSGRHVLSEKRGARTQHDP